MDARDCFYDLDFFIHYPQKDCLETSDRSVIEAMAAGCPVLMSPAFQHTFGMAPVYCEPQYALEAIQALWKDQDAYLARAQIGRDFVLTNCDWAQFVRRLGNL
jgi:hypothetical protein